MSIIERLVNTLREDEQARPYHLERPDLRTESDAAEWLREYRNVTGDRVWLTAGERGRKRVGRRLLWLRWVHRERWIERGGLP